MHVRVWSTMDVRVSVGGSMLRPYIALIWALADYDNPVHVVRHDHRDMQRNPGEVFRNVTPTLTRDPSGGAEAHAPRHDLSEQVVTRSHADRHEVAPRTGVVESAKPQ